MQLRVSAVDPDYGTLRGQPRSRCMQPSQYGNDRVWFVLAVLVGLTVASTFMQRVRHPCWKLQAMESRSA